MKKEVYSGISFRLSNQSSSKNGLYFDKIINYISQILIIMLLSSGSIFTFTTMMGVNSISSSIIYVLIAVLSVTLVVLYNVVPKKWLVTLISLGVVLLISGVMYQSVISGGKLIYLESLKSIYNAMYWTLPKSLEKLKDEYIAQQTLVIALLSVIVTVLSAYFTTARTHFIGAFLVTFPLFEIGAAFGCIPQHFPFALLLAGWCASLVLHIANRQKSVVKHISGKKSIKKKNFVYKQHSGKFGGSALTIAIAVLLVFGIVASALSGAGYDRGEKTNEMRKSVKEYVLNKYDLITGYDHDASLREGKLYDLGDRKVKNRHYITAKVPDTGGEDIYLAGYVGSVYTGYSWKDIDESSYSQIKEFNEFLKERGYSVATLSGDALSTYIDSNDLKRGTFTLSEFRRKKDYSYLSIGAIESAGYTPVSDKSIKAPDNSSYTYDAYYKYSDLFKVSNTVLYSLPSFQKANAQYTKFVQDNYTLLPSGIEDITRLANELKSDSSTIYQLVDKVRNFLSENITYSNLVAKMGDDDEFSSFFIYDQQRGYSAHYATAAAVMLRALGVPTRYVEGYYISSEQLDKDGKVVDNGVKQLQITDDNAHAWIEIYDSNYGWIPVEVTAGFYTKSMQSVVKKAKAQAKEDYAQALADKKSQDKSDKDNNTYKDENVSEDKNSEQEVEVEQDMDQETKKVTDKEKSIVPWIVLGAVVFLIVCFVLFVIFRRNSRLRKREKIFDGDNYRQQVILGFELFLKMLKYRGLDIDKLSSYQTLFEQVLTTGNVDSEKLSKVIDIYKEAMFSHNYISDLSAAVVLDFIDEFGEQVYDELSFIKRIKFKFVSNIA